MRLTISSAAVSAPKYIYTIPTVQNPTGSIMPEARRAELLKLSEAHGVPMFEDDCYADLIWDGKRPPAIYAMSRNGGVVHIGSFSKSIAPALRIGYIVAGWDILSRALSIKTDAGSGALEQMVLAEYCAPHFASHVSDLSRGLRVKLDTLMEALAEQFGTAAEFEEPKGGIFLWVKLPDNVDTQKLYQPALKAGVAINPGPEWSVDKSVQQEPDAALLREPDRRRDPRRHRRAGRGVPRGIRRADAQRERHARRWTLLESRVLRGRCRSGRGGPLRTVQRPAEHRPQAAAGRHSKHIDHGDQDRERYAEPEAQERDRDALKVLQCEDERHRGENGDQGHMEPAHVLPPLRSAHPARKELFCDETIARHWC